MHTCTAAKIILSDETWKALPWRWGTRKGYPRSALLFIAVIKVLVIIGREYSELKAVRIGNEKTILSWFVRNMTVNREILKEFRDKIVELKINLRHFFTLTTIGI